MNEFNDDQLPASESLKQLAEAHGVSTEYWDYHGNLASPSSATLKAVLAALGVSTHSEEEIGRALREVEDAPWRPDAPLPTVVYVAAAWSPPSPSMCPTVPRYGYALSWRTAASVS